MCMKAHHTCSSPPEPENPLLLSSWTLQWGLPPELWGSQRGWGATNLENHSRESRKALRMRATAACIQTARARAHNSKEDFACALEADTENHREQDLCQTGPFFSSLGILAKGGSRAP